MTSQEVGEVKTYCETCNKEFISTITVHYIDYTSSDIVLSGCSPQPGEKPKVTSWVSDRYCSECRAIRNKEADEWED